MTVDWVDWLGDLNKITPLTAHSVGVICIAVSGLCGAIIGAEREKREKPAGLRTLILICMGSTIFTLASLLLSEGTLDRGRIAAQVVTGIGFLGAGAIIHERRAVVGLTTGATIWAVSAIGVIIGAGFAAAGFVLTMIILLVLTLVRVFEERLAGPCRMVSVRIQFLSYRGKSRPRLRGIFDDHHANHLEYTFSPPALEKPGEDGKEWVDLLYCSKHRHHHQFLAEVASLPEVQAIEEAKDS